MPLPDQPLRFPQTVLRAFPHGSGHARPLIHHALAEQSAQADRFHDLKNRIFVPDRPHIHQRRGSAADQLQRGQSGGNGIARGAVRSFQRPGAFFQPVHQFQVVTQPPEQNLRDVHVRLNQTGQQHTPGHVHPFRVPGFGQDGDIRPQRRDAIPIYQNIRIQNIPPGIHGHNPAAMQQVFHASVPSCPVRRLTAAKSLRPASGTVSE